MKKAILALLILGVLSSFAACSQEKPGKETENSTENTTTSGTADPTAPVSTEKEPDPFDDLSDDDPVNGTVYVYDDYTPYLGIGDLSLALKVDMEKAKSMTKDELDKILKSFCGLNFIPAEEGESLAEGDQAVIFYTGRPVDSSVTLDEDTLAGMTNADDDKGFGLVIGSGAFIGAYESEEHPENNNPGFEEQLIGAKAGETRSITVTFPDSYSNSPELRGMPVIFEVKIVSFGHPDDPTELTDEMVSEYTSKEYTTVEALTEYLVSYYKPRIAFDQACELIEVIGYPQDELKEFMDSYMDYYLSEDSTEEEKAEIQAAAEKQAKETIGDQIVRNYLYSRFEVVLTKKQYYDYLKENFEMYGMYYQIYYGITSIEGMEDYFGRDYLISEFKYRHLMDYLSENTAWAENTEA